MTEFADETYKDKAQELWDTALRIADDNHEAAVEIIQTLDRELFESEREDGTTTVD